MNSPPAAVPTMSMTARWDWKRLTRWLLAFIIANGVVYWWLFVRLSSLEQQLVGTWEGTRDAGDGRTVKLNCELHADRTAAVEFVSFPNQQMFSVPQRIHLKQPTWHERGGHLRFQELLSPWTRIQLQYYRIQAWFRTGTAEPYRQIDGLGPIRDVRPGSFELGEWHMKRVKTRTTPD